MDSLGKSPALSSTAPDSRLQLQVKLASTLYSSLHDCQTRLIFLQPSAVFDGPLVAELQTVELLHGPGVVLAYGKRRRIEYTALSYCWGAPDFVKDIEVNGQSYPITEKLFDALLHLRDKENVGVLWVDALCINQSDLQERSMQITNMITIFSKAFEVIAWVGRITPTVEQALKNIVYDRNLEGQSTEVGLQELLRRPWFRRVWVKQEVFAATKLYLQCGEVKVEWDRIHHSEITKFLRRTPVIRTQIEEGESSNIYLEAPSFAKPKLGRRATDIINVLRSIADSHASDPRDLIYGVLGMTRTVLQGPASAGQATVPLPVDYNRNAAEVFADLARYIMQRDRCLNVLLCTAEKRGDIGGRELPSWVPDWRYLPWSTPWLKLTKAVTSWLHSRGPSIPAHIHSDIRSSGSKDYRILRLQGFVLGNIGDDFTVSTVTELRHWGLADASTTLDECCNPRDAARMKQYESYMLTPALSQAMHDLYDPDTIGLFEWPEDELRIILELPSIVPRFHTGFQESVDDHKGLGQEVKISTSDQTLIKCEMNIPKDHICLQKYEKVFFGLLYPHRSSSGKVMSVPIIPNTKCVTLVNAGDELLDKDVRKKLTRCVLEDEPEQFITATHLYHDGAWMSTKDRRTDLIPRHWVVPEAASIGDSLVVLEGGMLPMLLRQSSEGSYYRFIGPAAYAEPWSSSWPNYSQAESFNRYNNISRLLRIHTEGSILETFDII